MSGGKHLSVVAAQRVADPPEGLTDLGRGLWHANRNLERRVASLREDLQRASEWQECWIEVIDDIGDLLHRAKDRPKGRRFASILELDNLLEKQGRSKKRDET